MPLGGHFKLSLKDCPVRDCDIEMMSKVPYANAGGSVMYLMVCIRPDIAYAGLGYEFIFSSSKHERLRRTDKNMHTTPPLSSFQQHYPLHPLDQGAQGNREAEVFQVSNDVTVVAQRRLKDKKLEEKTNTDCLVKKQKKV
nr:retrovirus-related Pol polyprotein from transposon TNT 1-94 [Tanacetum cinerariifolium]